MGVLPCQFKGTDSVQTLGITGEESYDLIGVEGGNIKPLQDVTLVIHRKDGSTQNVAVTLRVDSPIEVEYLKNGGILPFVLRELMAS
jgi:aconitate hydratase